MRRATCREPRKEDRRNRGSALIAVLWTVIVLTAVGFALSASVRNEIDRASLQIDSTKAYFLAHGAIEAAMQRIVRRANPEKPDEGFTVGQRFMRFQFESGSADIEIVGENGKLDVNQASPEALARLLVSSGMDSGRALNLASAVAVFRERLRQREVSLYGTADGGQINPTSGSSFDGQPTSIQETEELLVIPGITPDLLYGAFRETTEQAAGGRGDARPRLLRTGGLMRNLTTRGSTTVNVNYASREMLLAAGLTPDTVRAVETIRAVRPLTPDDPGMSGLDRFRTGIRLGLGGLSRRYTLTAVARLAGAGSDGTRAVRSVSAVVEFGRSDGPDPIRIVRWYDQPF